MSPGGGAARARRWAGPRGRTEKAIPLTSRRDKNPEQYGMKAPRATELLSHPSPTPSQGAAVGCICSGVRGAAARQIPPASQYVVSNRRR